MREIRDNRKLGQATLTHFHKVKVICVGENANNSKGTNLLGGFTVVVIAFLDLSYNYMYHSRKSRSRSAKKQRLQRLP